MKTYRQGLVWASYTVLPVTLFCLGASWSIFQVIRTPDPLKGALQESGIYGAFVTDTIARSTPETLGTIPIQRPEVQAAVKDAFPPAYIEQQTSGMIDGLYAWMQGKTATLEFTVNLAEAQTKLSDGLGHQVEQRLAALPVCTTSAEIAAASDPWSATCVPPGFDRSSAVQQVRNQINQDSTLLEDSTFTSGDLRTAAGETIEQRLAAIPRLYQQLGSFLLVMLAASVVVSLMIVFLSPTRRQGIKRLAFVIVFSGVSSSAMALLITAVTSRLEGTALQQEGTGQVPQHVAKAIHILATDLRGWWLGYGLALLALGIGTLITLLILRKRREHYADIHGPVSFSTPLQSEDKNDIPGPGNQPLGKNSKRI